jgi:putative hydrolase of the HAD superfamily
MNQMQKVTLIDEVRYTLGELQKQGITMYILSNSIFTANSANKLLNDFGIIDYFEKIYSSADYGVRKPSSRFYQIAIAEILANNPELTKDDILYVGNDYDTDIIGATSVGLSTVWYNEKHLINEKNICTIDTDNFKILLEIVER